MVKLRFFSGIEGEVGGNQILLEDGETKILLDFGINFGRWRSFFSFPLSRPRGVEDYFRVGLIPRELRDRETGLVGGVDACIITHPHSDHYAGICALPSGENAIPVYLGQATHRILKAKLESRRSAEAKAMAQLDFKTYRTGDRLQIGDVEIRPWHVDHSTPGAYVLIIHTTGGTIVYTGDFRLHGSFGKKLTQKGDQFWQKLEGEEIQALICEATNFGEPVNPISEEEVERLMHKCVEACRGLVIVNTSTSDVDRLRTICRVAKETQRQVIATKYFWPVLEALQEDEKLNAPKPKVDVIPYEEAVDEIKKRQSDYILLTSFYREKEILEVEPVPGSYFILSSSEPFEEEGEIEFSRLKNWLNLFGVPIYHVHTSGHAFPMHLMQVIEALSPKLLYPVHTEAPQALARMAESLPGVCAVLPEKGVEYRL